VYRLLFLLVAEERGLIFPPDTQRRSRDIYSRFYSLSRLRNQARRKHLIEKRHTDLWSGLLSTFRLFEFDGPGPALGIAPLGGHLFAPDAIAPLNEARLSNGVLLEAISRLCFFETAGGNRTTVNYGALATEEFGSVYESLLELHPVVNGAAFSFQQLAGNERKTSGSYYTPDSLVQCLLDTALDPVVAQATQGKSPEDAAEALLKLRVCDPAAGSGHFILAAARRMARQLALIRCNGDEPSPAVFRTALRDVISHCIYAVDINPMAVELCKINLWIEAMEPGKPLSFLDHHIQCGNSLLGTTPGLMAQGIPDDAFKPIEGDDKKFCAEYRNKNKADRAGQLSLFSADMKPWQHIGNLAASIIGLDDLPDDTPEAIRAKEKRYAELVNSGSYESGRQLADAWCAAFVWIKSPLRDSADLRENAPLPESSTKNQVPGIKNAPTGFDFPITTEQFSRMDRNPFDAPVWMRDEIRRLSKQYQFFHWHLAFPEVFQPVKDIAKDDIRGWTGGFDVLLGNPPWERIQVEAIQFFALRKPALLKLKRSDRESAISRLAETDPQIFTEWLSARRSELSTTAFLKSAGRYPLSTQKNVNSYAVFLELALSLTGAHGRSGMILQSGVATDDIMKPLFQSLITEQRLNSFHDFVNLEGLFPGIHRTHPHFCLLTTTGRGTSPYAEFSFWNTNPSHLLDPERRFSLTAEELALLNPNTQTCPIFRSIRDATLAISIYQRIPVLLKEQPVKEHPWHVSLRRMFDMAYDSHLFIEDETVPSSSGTPSVNIGGKRLLRLYEAKLIHQFDHRFASFKLLGNSDCMDVASNQKGQAEFFALPRYWVTENDYENKMAATSWRHNWIVAFRQITNSSNERTAICAVLPIAGVGHSCYTLTFEVNSPPEIACFSANSNAFILDWLVRQKQAGMNLSVFILKQLPFLTPEVFEKENTWAGQHQSFQTWLLPRILELTYTAWDLEAFARDCGYDGPPFRWDEERRFEIRCELDAAFFHLYLPADEHGQWKPASTANGAVRDETPQEREALKKHFPTPRHAVDYIMDTFPIVKRKDETKHGEYRTKRRILEIYDAMATATRTATPYQTQLNPPPGPPVDAMPDWQVGHSRPTSWPSHIHAPKGCSL
jgi:hypothetical protein